MFGRDLELARIDVVLERASSGAVGLAVEGGPGIGKSTVWREAVGRARGRGWLVLEAAPGEPDAALGFAGLGDLFDGLPAGILEGLPDPQRRAVDAALYRADSLQAPVDVLALPRAVLSVIRLLADTGVVVLAVDDEQWLDHASARVLSFALKRVRDERVCLLLARRAGSGGVLWGEVCDRFAGGVDVLELGPLGREAVDRLVRSVLRGKLDRRAVARVCEVSGGNPLYALAIARELARAGDVGDGELRLPASLTDAVRRRLRRLPARAAAPLFVAAAASHPTLELLAAVVDGFQVRDLDAAVSAGVVAVSDERVAFTHPLLASVHRDSVAAEQRRALHLRLARVIADPEQSVMHLALGSDAGDERVAGALQDAAVLAARRGAPEAAAELFTHAARLTPVEQEDLRWSRTIDAAEQHSAAGDLARARELLEGLLAGALEGSERARALLALARSRPDDYSAVRPLLEQALQHAGDDHWLRTRIERVFVNLSSNFGDFAARHEHALAAVRSAEILGEPAALASALAALGTASSSLGLGLRHDLFERALELENPDDETLSTMYLPSTAYGANLRYDDDLAAARPLLEFAEQRARRRGEAIDHFVMLNRLACVTWLAGDLAAADRYLAAAAQSADEQDNIEIDSWMAHVEGMRALARGELELAREKAEQELALASENNDVHSRRDGATLLAEVQLRNGEPDAAHAILEPLRSEYIARGPWLIAWWWLPPWSCDIEALIATGRLDEAQAVLDDLRERAGAGSNPHAVAVAARSEGLLLGARGEIAAAIEAMQTALGQHARRPLPLEIARTLLEKGALERRAKRKSAAHATLSEALENFDGLGAELWAARARDELSRVGLRRRSNTEGLTPSQRRVAELAVAGKTNVEIAQTLFMGQRTVEAHLTNIYRELGVKNRTQLAAAMPVHGKPQTLNTHS